MPFLCYKCHKMIYNGSPEFHNIFCKTYRRNTNNFNNYRDNYRNNYNYNNQIDNRNNRNNYYSRNNSRNNNRNYNSRNNNNYNRYNNRNYYYRDNNNRYKRNYYFINTSRNNDRNNDRHSNNRILDMLNNDDLELNLDFIDFIFNFHDNNNRNNNNNNDNNNDNFDSLEDILDLNNLEENGLDEEIINSFPKSIVDDINKLKEKKCVICLEEFQNGDEKTTLPCFHIFHPNCINQWLKKHDNCPICKTKFEE